MISNKQKSILAQLAARAFKLRPRAVAAASALAESKDAQDEWRHNEVAKACGKNGLRCCLQSDYKLVEAHFLRLLGEDGRAFGAYQRAATEPVRVAQVKLMQALEQWSLPRAYAEKICRNQFKCSVGEASEKQLWNLKYTIDRAGRRRAGQPPTPRQIWTAFRDVRPAEHANN